MPKFGTFEKVDLFITAPMNEAAYHGNVGFEEMVRFYREASPRDMDHMEEVVRQGDWNAFRLLIKKVLKVELK